MDGAGWGSDAGLLAGGSWERGRVGTGTQRGGGGGKRPPPPPVRDRHRMMDGCLIFARDERGPWVCSSVFYKDQNGEQWEGLGSHLPQPCVLPALAWARCWVQGWRQEPASVPPNGGLQSHGGPLGGCKDPIGSLAAKAVCSQGPVCLVWLIQLRSREPRRWGHRQGG